MPTKKWLDSIEMTDIKSQDADHLVEVLETQVLEMRVLKVTPGLHVKSDGT